MRHSASNKTAQAGCTQTWVCARHGTTMPYQPKYANDETSICSLRLIHKTCHSCFSGGTEKTFWVFSTGKGGDRFIGVNIIYLFICLSIKELPRSLHMSCSLNSQYKGAALHPTPCQTSTSISAPPCGHKLLQLHGVRTRCNVFCLWALVSNGFMF